jgi:predicted RND superfamily exporter protein
MGPDFELTGPSLIFEEIRSSILRESVLAIFLSFAANWFIVGLHFRRLRVVMLAMVPVMAGTLFTLGAMGAAGIPFNFFNVAGIALIFGFGVDYGIYMMQSRGAGPEGDGAETIRRTGGSVILCAATTVASCGSLVTSQYRGLASIGVVLCLGAVFCMLSTVFLLPSLLRYADLPVRKTDRRAPGDAA